MIDNSQTGPFSGSEPEFDLPDDAPAFERAASAFPHAHGISYRPEIDGLRAVAVGSVILYHAALWPFTGGYVGVDIFFVISGYLISSIILSDISSKGFSFATFYERRIRRIFPALFLVIACSLVPALLLFTPLQLREFGQALAATTLFASNIYFWLKAGYFSADTQNNALIHMWSLSVEEQFYIAFPLLLIALYRLRIRPALPVGVLLLASLAWCLHWQASGNAMANFFLVPSRAWELMTGTLVALYRPRWLTIAPALPGLAVGMELVGAALILMPIFTLTAASDWPGLATIPVVAGAALLMLATRTTSPLGRILASTPMVWIGLVSYSAYLWHQPVFAFAHVGLGAFSASVTAGLILLTFALAWTSWRFVERPFRTPGGFSRRWLFGAAALLTVIFGGSGLALHQARGLPQRFDAQTRALWSTAAASPMRERCHAEGIDYLKPAQACRYYGSHVTWAALGDSHTIEIAQALAEDLRTRGQGLVQLTFSGCQPALTFTSENPGCSAWLHEAVKLVEQDVAIRDVLLVFRHAFYLHGDQTRTYPALPDDSPNFLHNLPPERARALYWNSFQTVVRRLLAAGKRVHIVAPVPELPVSIDRYVFRGATAGITRDFYDRRNADVLKNLRSIARLPGVTLLDPAAAVCDASSCHPVIGGQALYFDDNHLSVAGARRFVASQRRAGVLP